MAMNFTSWLTQNIPNLEAAWRAQAGPAAGGGASAPPMPTLAPFPGTTFGTPAQAPTFAYSPTGPGGPGTGGSAAPQAGLTPYSGAIPQTMGQSYFPQATTPAAPAVSALPPTTALQPTGTSTGEGGQGGGVGVQGTGPSGTYSGFQADPGAVGTNVGTTFQNLSQIPLIGGPAQAVASKVGDLLTSVFGGPAAPTGVAGSEMTTTPIAGAQNFLDQAAAALSRGDYNAAMTLAEKADQLAGGVLGMTPGTTSVGIQAAVDPTTGQAVGEADTPDRSGAVGGGVTTDTGQQLNTGDTAASGGFDPGAAGPGSPGGDGSTGGDQQDQGGGAGGQNQ